MKKNKPNLQKKVFYTTRSFFRFFSSSKIKPLPQNNKKIGIKVSFIHSQQKINTGLNTGATQINQLMAKNLLERGVQVKDFYPRKQLTDTPLHLRGVSNILFFYSLLEHKTEVLKSDIIQGTTYTPLPFTVFNKPVICHFGSTTRGFLESIPRTKSLLPEEKKVFKELVKLEIISELDLKTFRPMEDIADIEAVTAFRATACIATSKKVREELIGMGIATEKIHVIDNAIEDYWFNNESNKIPTRTPHIVFLGRLGNDVFTLKIKGFSRLVNFYRAFPDIPKTTICMTTNRKLKDWLKVSFPKHYMFVNLRKDLIPGALAPLYGSILFISSRYEGFSLSLVEGMSQGLIPISFAVGIAPEIIENGKNGFIVSTEKEAERRADELLHNPEKRNFMARNALETAKRFQSKHSTQELVHLYRKVKEEHRQSRVSINQKSA